MIPDLAKPNVASLLVAFLCAFPLTALAQNDLCEPDLIDPETGICSGNQSDGVDGITDIQAGADTLIVKQVSGPIVTSADGEHGIVFERGLGDPVTIESGEVDNRVDIDTQGAGAYGVYGRSNGSNGGNGTNGSCFSLIPPEIDREPTRGGNGQDGGAVAVTVNGTISTSGNESAAITAVSRAGSGGAGGDGGGCRSGALGGIGGNAATVVVRGEADIETAADRASGIIAVSAGGQGGNGGGAAFLTGGGNGGSGGKAGGVEVDGDWDIRTAGDQAHGIWAKSVGGNAGNGGGPAWAGTQTSGSGGQAADGGAVRVISSGVIITSGDDAYGLYAQSVGGFGGDGGGGFGLFSSSGGNGNSAGSGGSVVIETQPGAGVSTTGDRSHAIFAQSIGGGGGSGGGSDGFIADAGAGAPGGNGGAVQIINSGIAATAGRNAHALYAQSIGGGGGDGGSASGAGAVGGRASATSDGGTVEITNTGFALTFAALSKGIYAQSIGGSGGDGGDSSGIVSVGGTGGGGGDGDTVTVNNTGSVQTYGNDSAGIFAQSVGGGGGNGGSSDAFGAGVSVAIGGNGGAGGDAGDAVVVDNVGTILTGGNRSHGVQAQSVGGGGGNGGYAVSVAVGKGASLAAAFGGNGGSAGSGQVVNVNHGGTLVTEGKDAHGIFAQSVGGGGGSGGFSVAASGGTGFSGALAMGGQGGSGGSGGDVVVTSSGDITTGVADRDLISIDQLQGANASTLDVLTAGGINTISALAAADAADLVAIGFDGSANASVDVLAALGIDAITIAKLKQANLLTIGDLQGREPGDLTEFRYRLCDVSIGGVCFGTEVIITLEDAIAQAIVDQTAAYIQTIPEVILDTAILQNQRGNHAYGILAQSVGGGGGDGGFSVAGTMNAGGTGASFSMGGDGGAGGPAGNVTLDSTGNVTTYGDDSHAIVAQSVGGGGGTGGFSVSGSLGTGNGIAASLGGNGGDGSVGGAVQLGQAETLSGNINTQGDHAYGVLAQSIGGGGGDGGFSVAGAISQGSSAAFSMGGGGGSGGTGGEVSVNAAANISTVGRDSHAFVAQSIGGGGGSGGFSVAGGLSRNDGVAASIGGSGGTGGHAGAVTVVNSGVIQTGIGGQRSATLDTLEDLDPTILALLQENGFETIAELAEAAQSELTDIDGIDEALADELLENAFHFMQQDSRSYGILAQSSGGGGGDGGFSIAGSFSKDGNGAAFSMGGSGGSGGNGGIVDVQNEGTVVTRAEGSTGILAQSVGGGGGSGGFSVAGQMTLGDSKSGLSFSLGGSGAEGGSGDLVSVNNTGDILTEGGDAHGIHAQSVGGGGGTGGFSAAGKVSGNKSKQIGISLGGSGGAGGTGGDVDVANRGQVATLSNGSNAIYAQSVGGGGGDGGVSFTGSFGNKESRQISAALGGAGGIGNRAGTVDVANGGALDTFGDSADGIKAQSVGGGGGSGGFSVTTGFATSGTGQSKTINANVSLGGNGGKGGAGGEVVVRNCELDTNNDCVDTTDGGASIVTRGDDSRGIFAQSVGGGGGDGGSSLTATVGLDPKADGKSLGLAVSLGGTGGDGNVGGNVVIMNDGLIDTLGKGAHGVFAQSVGGGGGSGGSARTTAELLGKKEKPDPSDDSKQTPENDNKSMAVAIGGSGGSGGTGGDVTIDNAGDIITRGADSHGLFGQSIGGGGGEGGNGAHGTPEAEGFGGALDSAINAAASKADEKYGLEFSKSLEIVVGGNGGVGNHGGNVDIDHNGTIVTLSDGSNGVLAQSVGAGGGIGGNAALGQDGEVGLGGSGGASGDGGDVEVDISGDMLTVGTAAHAVFAQSVGGGGGIAGNVDFGIIDSKTISRFGQSVSTPALNIGIGAAVLQEGGSAGNGGDIAVNTDGMIMTVGHAAIGIFAQSVGGGGGLSGDTGFGVLNEIKDAASCFVECDAWAGSAGGDGAGGDINISHTGTIQTSGDVAHGIFAQSSGGSSDNIVPMIVELDDDGNVVTEDLIGEDGMTVLDEFGDPVQVPVWEESTEASTDLADLGGDINIAIDGDILINGEYAHGIFAHSVGGDGAGNITIDLLGGTVQGGSNSGVGVRFKGGAANTLNNYGTLTSLDGVFGDAIFADVGDESIFNFGTITGNVDLGIGVNAFFNNTGATLESGTLIYMGDGNTLTNTGVLSPGGTSEILTTTLTGDFLQRTTGSMLVNLDQQAGIADRIDVIGAVDLGGSLDVLLTNPDQIMPGSGQVTILTATGGITDSGLDLMVPSASAVAQYDTLFSGTSDLLLSWDVSFAPTGLNENGTAIGEYIDAVQLAGGSGNTAPVVAALFALPDTESLSAAYDMLSPQVIADNQVSSVNANMQFSDALLSCKSRDGTYRFSAERQCAWVSITTRDTSLDASTDNMGFDESAWQVAGGAQKDLGNDWVLGGAWSYEDRSLTSSTGMSYSEGHRMQGGLVVKRGSGPSIVSTSLTVGLADFENRRTALDGEIVIGDQQTQFYAGQLRGEYTFEYERSYIKPRFDLGVTHFVRDGYTEEGDSLVALSVDGSSDTHIYGQLALEAGFERIYESGLVLRPSMSVGLTQFLTDNQPGATASIIGAPSTAGSFIVSSKLDRTYVDFDLGFDLLTESNMVFRLNAFGRTSSNAQAYGANLKMSFPF